MIFFLLLSFAVAQVEMAITVDDLPSHGDLPHGVTRLSVTEKMLKVFKKHQVPEVYGFVNAERVFRKPELKQVLEAWIEAGYPIGNHVYSHPDLTKNSVEDFQAEILQNEPILRELSGSQNWKVFRYPYLHEGDTIEKRNAVRKFLFDHGYQIAQVTIDFEDWAWNDPYARCKDKNNRKALKRLDESFFEGVRWSLIHAEKIADGLFQRPIKHILLLHVGGFTTDHLDKLLNFYKQQGVRFIPLNEALKDPIYAHDPKQADRRAAEFTYQILKERGLKPEQFDPRPRWSFPGKELQNICQ